MTPYNLVSGYQLFKGNTVWYPEIKEVGSSKMFITTYQTIGCHKTIEFNYSKLLVFWYQSVLTISGLVSKYIRHCCPTSFGRMSNYVRTCLFRGSPIIFRSYCPRWPCMRYQRTRECFFCLLLPSGSYSLNFLRSECHFVN
jgi:hypothetical protein